MQKLVWQNANGETIDLTSGSYGITEWEGFSNASLNIQSQQVPFQDGAVFLDALIEPRELNVTLAMQDNNDLELRYQLRRELIHKLNPKLGEGYLIYTNDFISKRIKCVAQIPLFETHNSNDSGTPKASLSWVANEPYWEDLEETVVAISGLNTVQNEGDVSAQVEIIIPTGASNPAIANRRNQKQIKLLGSYDDTVEINTNLGQKYAKSEVLDFTWVSGGTFYSRAFGNGKYVYIGTQIVVEDYLSGKIVSVDSGNNVQFNDVIFADGQFIAVGQNGTILASTDGINWISRTSGTSVALRDIVYGNNLFVVVGSGSPSGCILTSSDGENWTIRGQFTNVYRIAHSTRTSLFVAVGLNGLIVTSNDGVNWVERTSGTNKDLYGVAYSENNDCFIAVGAHGLIIKSTDGITWTQVNTEITEELRDIMYCPDNIGFVCVGDNGLIATSKDGNTWTKYYNFYGATLTTSVYKNADILIGGENATILKLEEVAGENCIDIISADSDMSFNLDVGMNNMLIQKATGGMSASLKFRQKYIGV